MNITQESTGNLTAVIRVEVLPEDYAGQVLNSLKEIQKKSALKGFRPGKVPFGLIKKMYEKGAKAEEVNKILGDSLNKYLVDNKIEILGYPIANAEMTKELDFDNEKQLDFYFDIGLTPSFDVDVSKLTAAEYYEIRVEDKVVDKYQEDISRRYGKLNEFDSIEDNDLVEGEIKQLDESGNPAESGMVKNVILALKDIKDEEIRKAFIGKKKDETLRFNPMKATGSAVDTAAMLGIKKEEAENLTTDFEFRIIKGKRIEPAELNEDLFSMVYPRSEIKDLEMFRQKIREEMKSVYQSESDSFFVHTTMEKLIDETQIDLPAAFIKKWLVDSDKNLTAESVENNLDDFLKSLKNQLVIGKISSKYNIKISDQEIRDHVKNYYTERYNYGMENESVQKYIETLVDSVLKSKEEVNRIQDKLLDNKLNVLFKENIAMDKKEITYDEFVKVISEHHKIHHHEHE